MKKENIKRKIRLARGGILGAIILGGINITWINRNSKEQLVLPFITKEETGYKVMTQELSIDEIVKGQNDVVISETSVDYLTKSELEQVPSLEVDAKSPWNGSKSTGIINKENENKVMRQTYHCEFDLGSLTKQDLAEKIDYFQEGNMEKVLENCDFEIEDSEEAKVLTKEELEKEAYSATMTLHAVNENDTMLVPTPSFDKKERDVFFVGLSIIGANLGLLTAFLSELKEEREMTEDSKVKTKGPRK